MKQLFLALYLCSLSCLSADPKTRFWNWFRKRSQEYLALDESNRDRLFDQLAPQLRTVHPNLTFEFGPPSTNGPRDLIISADGIQEAFPAVRDLVSVAPYLPGWKVIAFRQPHPGLEIHYNSARIRPGETLFTSMKHGDKVDVILYVKGYKSTADFETAGYLLLDSELGEFDVETYLGGIDFTSLELAPGDALPLTRLAETIKSLKR
ncbi:MAG TPA: hypothetical protein PKN93_15600 [Leptospiraceae bacterium]|nr:hypothetical protein [Leptospiraceae bacterium]